MTDTVRSALFVPELLAEVVQEKLAGVEVLVGTDAVLMNPSLPAMKRGGDTVTIPYFQALAKFQRLNEDDPAVPAAITMDSETSVIVRDANIFNLSQWAQLAAAYADPYTRAADMIRAGVSRAIEDGCVVAAGLTALSLDVYSSTTPVYLTYDVMVAALAKWKDEQTDIALLSVHSDTLAKLRLLRDSLGRPLLLDMGLGKLPMFMGVPVVVSDINVKTTDSPPKYTSLIIKKGAIAAWFNGDSMTLQTFHDVYKDTDTAAMHLYHTEYAYRTLPGRSLGGVVKIIHN